MLKKRLLKKMGWITLLVMPMIYIPTVIVYKSIHYLKSGVDITSDNKEKHVDAEEESLININDELGVIDIGPIKKIDSFHVIERINLIKQLDLDYKQFDLNVVDDNVSELMINTECNKYIQNEPVLVKYEIKDNIQKEFKIDETKINFSLFEKVDLVKFNKYDSYIDIDAFELIFSKRFLKLGPLMSKINLNFYYDKTTKPKEVKATYVGFDQTFEWSYSIITN